MIRYTPEQADAVDFLEHAQQNEEDVILLVEAGAGTGKTFMAEQFIDLLKPKTGLYTAFNKAIVTEGAERFSKYSIDCKTFHALAYQYVKPKKSIEALSYLSIKEPLNYSDKRYIITAIENFFVSASTDMYEYFEDVFAEHEQSQMMISTAAKYVEMMAEGELNPTFNFLLKFLHLSLLEDDAVIDVDLVILDEINDVTAVSLEIFKHIKAPIKIGLGETNQAIYAFLNLVNGFEVLRDKATTMRFTQSYRCSKQIASRINKAMQTVLSPDFKFVGTDEPVQNGKELYCTLTNAKIVYKLYERLKANKGFKLLRKPNDIFAAPMAVITASQGKKPYQKQYAYLEDVFVDYTQQDKYKNFYAYLQNELNDQEINNAVSLLIQLNKNNVNLFTLYNQVKEATVDENYVVSTVFTSKGLEFETVYIADDLNEHFLSAVRGDLDPDEAITAIRCYYVACSRAGCDLRNSKLRDVV